MKTISDELSLHRGRQNLSFGTEYHNVRKKHRNAFAKNLLNRLDSSENMNFISLACGYAGEESLLVKHFAHNVLLDQYPLTIRLVKQIYNNLDILDDNIEFVAEKVENYKPKIKFDVIYTSGASDWMKNYGRVVPKHYADFVSKHLQNNGVFIARLYAGVFCANLEDKKNLTDDSFLNDISESIKPYGLQVLEWDVCPKIVESNVLVIGKTDSLPKIRFNNLDEGVDLFVPPDKILLRGVE